MTVSTTSPTDRVVNMTMSLVTCEATKHSTVYINAEHATVEMAHSNYSQDQKTCYLQVSGRSVSAFTVTVPQFQFDYHSTILYFKLYIYDCAGESYSYRHFTYNIDEAWLLNPPITFVPGRCVRVELTLRPHVLMNRLVIQFNSTSTIPGLEVRFRSRSSGEVSTPFFDKATLCCSIMNSTARIDLPDHYDAILLSFAFMDIRYPKQCINVYDAAKYFEQTVKVTLLSVCITDLSTIWSFDRSIVIHYESIHEQYEFLGFKALFSFQLKTDKPLRTTSGLLDCSGTNYESFKFHVACNFNHECEQGEDEAGCPYTSNTCRDGIAHGDKCFKYHVHPTTLSWIDARKVCGLRNEDLASFNTVHQMDTVEKLIEKTWKLDMYVGLTLGGNADWPIAYNRVFRWNNGKSALNIKFNGDFAISSKVCGRRYMDVPFFKPITGNPIKVSDCKRAVTNAFICERIAVTQTKRDQYIPIHAVNSTKMKERLARHQLRECPKGHVTHDFLSCTPDVDCLSEAYVSSCTTEDGGTVEMFTCEDGVTVPYTEVCDHHADCPDQSDENWCRFPHCEGSIDICDKQCIRMEQVCDGVQDCLSGTDEVNCMAGDGNIVTAVCDRCFWYSVKNISIITMDGHGLSIVHELNTSLTSQAEIHCPAGTHFRCPSWHCLPVYLRCNGVQDCPEGEDEVRCSPDPPCPGYYRCRYSKVCLHAEQVCDGVFHCPQQDDERYCNLTCPSQCQCQGLAFVCPSPFPATLFPDLRYLNAAGSGMRPADVNHNFFLVFLVLANCGIEVVDNLTLVNLRSLDVSHNLMTTVTFSHFSQLPNLQNLALSWNPITQILTGGVKHGVQGLQTLDLAGLQMTVLSMEVVAAIFPEIIGINVSWGQFHTVRSFQTLKNLKILDMTGSPVEFYDSDVFHGLDELSQVYTDNYKLCCRQILPEAMNPNNCFSPVDEVSSCDNLLRSPGYRAFLWLFALIAVLGNIFSFVVRTFILKNAAKTGFGVFVTHLSLSDLLMGVYLAVIGVADQVFRGSYLWKDLQWKQSAVCQAAGFLSLLSNEMSALVVCLITLDRFLVLRFPFSQRHFGMRSAQVASFVAWVISFIMAAVPLLPVTSHWEFYGQTGICSPLPITRKWFAGQAYSFGIIIVANFVLFVLIAVGQIFIFTSIRANTMPSNNSEGSMANLTNNSNSRGRDLVIARRLAVIVVSNFLCWFPIGLLGLLAHRGGVPIPGEAGVAVAIFVLPLNSALNPFLYTVSVVMARRARRQREDMMRILEARLRAQPARDLK